MNFSSGAGPDAQSPLPLTITMTRIVMSPSRCGFATPRLFPGRDLRVRALGLLFQFRRELLAEILRLEQLPDLDLGVTRHRVGAALDPFDRLFLCLHFPDPEAGDEF